jgi:hypothetical protein
LSEVAPASARQVLFGEACEVNAVEFRNVVTERFEDAANDAVATRVDFDAGLVAVGFGGI